MIRISRKAINQLKKYHGLTEEQIIHDVKDMEGDFTQTQKYEIMEDDNNDTN